MSYTEEQMRCGGRRFAEVLRGHRGATPRELARLMDEPIQKINARLESRRRFLGALRRAPAAGREVVLPYPRKQSRFAVQVDMYCRCVKDAHGQREHYRTRWPVWFPKSVLRRDGENWLCPQNYYDAKKAEAASQSQDALDAGAELPGMIRIPDDMVTDAAPLPARRAEAGGAEELPAGLQPELFAL